VLLRVVTRLDFFILEWLNTTSYSLPLRRTRHRCWTSQCWCRYWSTSQSKLTNINGGTSRNRKWHLLILLLLVPSKQTKEIVTHIFSCLVFMRCCHEYKGVFCAVIFKWYVPIEQTPLRNSIYRNKVVICLLYFAW